MPKEYYIAKEIISLRQVEILIIVSKIEVQKIRSSVLKRRLKMGK